MYTFDRLAQAWKRPKVPRLSGEAVSLLDRVFKYDAFPDNWSDKLLKEFPRPPNVTVGPVPKPNEFITQVKFQEGHVPSETDYMTMMQHILQ